MQRDISNMVATVFDGPMATHQFGGFLCRQRTCANVPRRFLPTAPCLLSGIEGIYLAFDTNQHFERRPAGIKQVFWQSPDIGFSSFNTVAPAMIQ